MLQAKVILENIGYPDYLRSKKDLDEKYDGVRKSKGMKMYTRHPYSLNIK